MGSVALHFRETMAEHGLEAGLALTTDDFTWTVWGRPDGPFRLARTYAKDEVADLMSHVRASLVDGPHVTVLGFTEDASHAFLEIEVRATSVNGTEYHNRGVHVFDIVDGRVAAVREYIDTAHAAEVFVR
ncbi:hypothetical protein GCM10023200_21130 [Actinomycetospora chlora]|uniref:SnoaL-like domain-containing protein n=1 Tax=Actinomycetospora chlora TaxID=663608 RepID=A0ABP9AXS3_9PSEU